MSFLPTTNFDGSSAVSNPPPGNGGSDRSKILDAYISPKNHYRLLWDLFGREAIAVLLSLVEVILLIWSAATVTFKNPYPESSGLYYEAREYSYVFPPLLFGFRASIEFVALVMAASMGKYRRVGATPLALEWQCSNKTDSIVLPLLMAAMSTTIYLLLYLRGFRAWHSISASPGGYMFLFFSHILNTASLVFLAWYRRNRNEIAMNGPRTLSFNTYARYLAIVYEGVGACMDLTATVVSDNPTSSVFMFMIEVLRTGWELWQDAKDLKATYSFDKLYLPLQSVDFLKNLNTSRREALKSNVGLNGVVLVGETRLTSAELVRAIVNVFPALEDGPISGDYWCVALGGTKRDTRYLAWLAIQTTLDSDLAWMDGEEVTINFSDKGVLLATRFDGNGLCGYSNKPPSIDRDGRITRASFWNGRDPNRPDQPIQIGSNPINLKAAPSVSAGTNTAKTALTKPSSSPASVSSPTSSPTLVSSQNSSYTVAIPPVVNKLPEKKPSVSMASGDLDAASQLTEGDFSYFTDSSKNMKILPRIETLETLCGNETSATSAALRVKDLEDFLGVEGPSDGATIRLLSRITLLEQSIGVVQSLEIDLGIEPPPSSELLERIERLEDQVGLDPAPGTLLKRIQAIRDELI